MLKQYSIFYNTTWSCT